MQKLPTFGSVLSERQGFGAGFDFVRIALALLILWFHSLTVTGEFDHLRSTSLWIVPNILVPMFFAVSGFLIAGSALRLKLRDFLVNRGLRIFPALAMDIAISALILGPIFTTLTMKDYWLDRDVWEYFGSVVGAIQYDLPGVFLQNESAGVVNQSLWTVPYEFLCYAVISLMMVTRLLHRPKLLLGLAILSFLLPISLQLVVGDVDTLPKYVHSLFFGRGSGSFQCFVAGINLYLFRGSITHHVSLAIGAAVIVGLVAVLGNQSWTESAALNMLLAPALTYFILFIGLSDIPRVPFYSTGDYSYGVYLYGYPIQQSIFATVRDSHNWVENYIIAVVLVSLIAVFSWHVIEKPILKLRKKFSFVGRRIAEADGDKAPETPSSPEAVTPGG